MDLTGGVAGGPLLFDLHSEAGVAAVLGVVKASTLSRDEKNNIRDLIFVYRTSGGDPTLRSQLEKALLGVTVTSATRDEVLPAEAGTAPVSIPATVASENPTVNAPITAKVAPLQPLGISRPTPQFGGTPVAIKRISTSPSPATPPTPPTPATPLTSETPIVSVPLPEPLATLDTSIASADEARNRIAVIKQTINQQVGNAVNLLDRDNVLGREYMAALLEAMKAASSDGDVSGTMRRLEGAFAAVEAMLTDSPQPRAQADAPTVPKMEVTPVITPVVPENAAPKVPSPAYPTPLPPSEPVVAAEPARVETIVPPVSHWDTPVEPKVVPDKPAFPVGSVAAAVPLKTLQDLPTAADMKLRSGVTDPLFAAEVDSGLDQLLSEWSLFKKSGMFGNGPKGRMHPLFLKLADTPVTFIIAGRADGVTGEVRQSVNDYVNGWRYEQGIIAMEQESFEHYLRRVIRHIIDLQTKSA